MAKQSNTFSGVPINRNVRKQTYRNARMGTRDASADTDEGNAMAAMTVAVRYRQAYVDLQPSIDALQAWADSWADRKSWTPWTP